MIKTYTLKFAFQEIEQLYTTSILIGFKYRREYTYITLCIYLILQIIDYNQKEQLLPQIIAGIGMALELALYLLMRKFWTKKELLITLNMIIMAVVCEILRLFGLEGNQWYYGHHSSTLKIIIYLQGSQFIYQSLIFILTEAASIYNFYHYDTTSIISHCLITTLLVFLRYQYEYLSRKVYLADLSKEQYDNLLEELLPSWVVILKYNKALGQLQIEKINRHLKEKFSIDNNDALSKFLRKIIVVDNEYQQQFFKIEHELIKVFRSKSEDHPVERYYGVLEKKQQLKSWKFKITQIYFKAFEPLVILLFEEIKEDKHDNYLNQIEQRDQQSYLNAKSSINLINQQIQLIQIYFNQILNNSFIKKDQTNQLIQNLKKQLQINYNLFNINSNLNYLYQISYRQLKYDYQDFNTDQFAQQLYENLNLEFDRFSKNTIKNKSIPIQLKTDKNKLISIIINIVDFIKILLSITLNDETILNQQKPLGRPVLIQIKKSKLYSNCVQFTLSHQNLNITSSIISLLHELPEITLDDKKRNWGSKNYYEMLSKINDTLTSLLDIYKKEIKSLTSISHESKYAQTSRNSPRRKQYSQFNTLGYIIAQYFVSQLGPTNKIQFRQTILEQDPINSISCYYGIQKTKISFTIFQNLDEFSQNVSKIDEKKENFNALCTAKKYSCQEITQRLLNLDFQ